MFKQLKKLFSKSNKPAKRHPKVLQYEELEPRVLFSADYMPGLDNIAVDQQVVFQDIGGNYQVEREATPETVEQKAAEERLELVIVNEDVADYRQLVADLQASDDNRVIEVVVLEADRDGIEQVSEILAERSDLAGVHFITHGSEGQINLGNSRLTSTTLAKNSDAVAGWGKALTETGDILFYGCKIAAASDGQTLLDNIAKLTGAEVAASDDLTGNEALGGDWELEYTTGTIETQVALSIQALNEYRAVLESASTSKAAYLSTPLTFEQNNGQTDQQVDFMARGSGYTVFLSEGDAVLMLQEGDAGHVVRLDLVGGDTRAPVSGADLLASQSNYLIGNDESSWQTDVANYGAVEYANVYDGIDLRYYGNQRQLEYDFIVSAGADTSQIRLNFEGVQSAGIGENGDLILTLNEQGDQINFKAPISYQTADDGTRLEVASRYHVLDDGTVGFELGDYDATQTLVIDPILDYATFLGGLGSDTAYDLAVDADGYVYVTGFTASTDFPEIGKSTTDNDVFVTKLSAEGTHQIYSTYFGGAANDSGVGIAVDASGRAHVVGSTSSADFPTVNAYNSLLSGATDAFVAQLSADGSSLQYSTFYGGSSDDNVVMSGIALDDAGAVYLTGTTTSNDLPTVNAYDGNLTGAQDVFVAKFDPDISGAGGLLYASYVGGTDGSGYDQAGGITVDGDGNIYVAGSTTASDSPTTAGAYQTAWDGYDMTTDGFLVKLDPNVAGAGGLLYGTYFHGTDQTGDSIEAVTVDTAGDVYLAGRTFSSNLQTTPGAYSSSFGGGSYDGFLAKLNPAGGGSSDVTYLTYLGGSGNDSPNEVVLVGAGKIVVAGSTSSTNFPQEDPTQGGYGGDTDAFVSVINPAGAGSADLEFSTYIGGDGFDTGYAVAVGADGSIFVSGVTSSGNFPATPAAFDASYNGGTDGFVVKFKAAATSVAPAIGLPGGAVNYLEGDGAVVIDAAATVSDGDSPDFDGGALVVSFTEGGTTDDRLAVRNQGTDTGEIGVSDSDVTYGGTIIGTLSGGMNGSALVITLNADADAAAAQALLRNVTYKNTTVDPDVSSRTVRFVLTDGDGGTSNAATETITLSPTYEILRPNAVGDATGIDTQSPITGAHWDKLDETNADNLGSYVATASTSYQQDLYNLTNHTGNGPINSITVSYDVASVADTTIYAIAYQSSSSYGMVKTVSVAGDGQINTEIDSISFDTTFATTPVIVQVSGSMYAIAYAGDSDDGYLTTVQIAANGQISSFPIDTLEFDTQNGMCPSLTHVSGDVYALAYRGKGDDGFLKTVQIAADGQITDTVVDELEFDTANGNGPDIIHVSGDIYAIAYQGELEDGFLKTVEITAAGMITAVDTLEFDGAMGQDPSITHVSGDVYAIAYGATGQVGRVKTVEIAGDGQITDTVIDTVEFDGVATMAPEIITVSDNVFAIAYEGSSGHGYLKTMEIGDDGSITATALDTLVFDTVNCGYPEIASVGGDVYVIAFEGPDSDGYLKIVSIAADGQINDAVIDSYEYDIANGTTPGIIAIAQTPGTTYARPVIKTDGTTYTGTEVSTSNATFTTQSYQWTTNPDTGVAWTWAEVDALQAGLDLRTDSAGYSALATQVYVVVDYENPLANQAPVVSLPGTAVDYTEGDGTVVIDATATVTDSDSPNFDTGTLTVDFTAGGSADDRLAIRNEGMGAGQIGVSDSDVTYNFGAGAITIGTFTGGTDGSTPLVVTLNLDADATAVQALVRNITYENVSEAPDAAARTVRFVLTDGDDGTSDAGTKTINVSSVNDAPVNTAPGSWSTSQDFPIVFSTGNGNQISITDADSGTENLEVTVSANNGTVTLNLPTAPGSERLINATTTSLQDYPSAAYAPDGSYVIVWTDWGGLDGDSKGIIGQRFDANDVPIGSEFVVNTTTARGQTNAQIGMDSSGNVVVVWRNELQSGSEIRAQRFDSSAAKVGGEILVSSSTDTHNLPELTVASNGDFVVVWYGSTANGGDVLYRRYAADATALTAEITVNTTTAGNQEFPSVAVDSSGNSVVTWSSDGTIYYQRFDNAGAAIGGNVQVSDGAGTHERSGIAMTGSGDFAIVWANEAAIRGRIYDSAGTAQGASFQISNDPVFYLTDPDIAIAANGEMIVVWGRDLVQNLNVDVMARRLTPDGSPAGDPFVVNATTTNVQWKPTVKINPLGGFQVIWHGEGPGDADGIFARRYETTGATFSVGDGIADETVTFQASLADINTMLDGMSYTPNPGYNGYDTLTITTNDLGNTGSGGAQSDVDTVTITVGNPSAPVIDLNGSDGASNDFATSWTENGGVVAVIDSDATLIDSDENLTQVNISISNLLDGASEVLAANPGATGLVVNYNSGTGVLTISGTGTAAQYQQVLRTVTYNNTSDNPTITARVIAFTATDTLSNGNTAMTTVTIDATNDAPVNTVPGAQATDPDTSLSFSTAGGNAISVGDPDSGSETIDVTLTVNNGTLAVDDGSFTAWGTESTANQYNSGLQAYADVAYASDGTFWATWSSAGQDGDSDAIVARHFAADGRPLADEFVVNTYTAGEQDFPAIAIDSAGNLLITWRDNGGRDGDTSGIYAQRLDATGALIGSDFLVNTTTSGIQESPKAAFFSDGGFVLAWSGEGAGDSTGVFLQRYNASGVKVDGETLVNTTTSGSDSLAGIAVDPSDNITVVWTHRNNAGSDDDAMFRRFDKNGVALTGEVLVNAASADFERAQGIAMDASGNFTITFHDATSNDAYFRQYDSNGTALGSQVKANVGTTYSPVGIAMAPTGEFAVITRASDTDSWGVYAQRFNADGSANGSRFRVNTTQTGSQTPSSIAMFDDNHLVVMWHGGDVMYQVYGPDQQATLNLSGTVSEINSLLEGMVYTPDSGYNGYDTLTITTDDQGNTGSGGAQSDVDTVTITVGNPSAPVIDLNGSDGASNDFATSWTENSGVVAVIDSDATLIDSDENLTQVNISISNLLEGASEVLAANPGATGLAVNYNSGTGVLTISGAGTAAQYQQVLRTVTYNNISENPNTTARVITFIATDALSNGNTATTTLGITAVNDAPVNAMPGAQTTAQDTDLVFSSGNGNAISVSDVDADTVEVTLTATNGTLTVEVDGYVGPEIRVNTTITDTQETPAIAVAADGSYVVAWASLNQDGSSWGVYAQRYDASGTAVGDEIQVHNSTTGEQQNPSVAIDDAGNFVVAWETKHLGTGFFNVFAQRFDASGNKVDGEFRVDAFAGANMQNASVAMNGAGAFVIAFEAEGGFDGNGTGIFARWYDSDGISQGNDNVNTTSAGDQTAPSVAMDDAGNFIVSWNSGAGGILFQRYDNAGKQGGEMTVTTAGYSSSVSADATGNFVVVWQSLDSSSWGVYGRKFNSAGTELVPEFLVNTHETDDQVSPDVAMNDDGEFVVVWESYSQDAAGTYGVYGQRYDATGVAVDGEFLINSTTDGSQRLPAVGLADSGRFTVTWRGNGDGDATGVFTKSYGLAVGFTDGNGTDNDTMTFSGTIADINTALEVLTFAPTASYNGPASLRIQTSDLGQTGIGGTLTDDDTIAITVVAPVNNAPTADAGGPYATVEGGSVTLDASGSSDPDGDTLTYSWDLDNDGVFGEPSEPTGENPVVSWATLQSFGIDDDVVNHTVGLRVDDGKGGTDTTSVDLTVQNTAPTLTVTGAASVDEGSTYTLNLGSSDPGNDTITSWTINWGDGTIDTVAGNPSSVTHVYTLPGLTYNITVSAMDEDGTYTDSNLLVASRQNDTFYLLDGTTGEVVTTLEATAALNGASEVVFGPDGNIYALSTLNDSVLKYDGSTGNFLGTFVTAGSGGLDNPQALTFGPDSHLYVGSYSTNEVLRYDGSTGAFIDVFVAAGTGGLAEPNALEFGQDGDLYVGSWVNHNVSRFDGQTGAFIEVVADVGASQFQTDFAFGPDGLLYVAHTTSLYEEIKVFDPATGTEVNSIELNGAAYAITFGPDGYLYASKWTWDKVEVWDTTTETLVRVFADSSIGLDNTWGIAFSPTIQVYVNDVNLAPVITSDGGGATANINVVENTTAVTTVTATDGDDDTPTYSISGGADAAKFTINSTTGELSFASAPDFETPTDTNADNVYEVTVQVSDGTLTDTQAISVTVTKGNESPIITSNGGGSSANINVAENQTAVTTVTATDADGETPTYSLISGADQALFDIDSNTGVLTFKTAPDFENPTDFGLDGTYEAVVLVTDGVGGTDTQMINVTVTNVNEGPDQNVQINENTIVAANVSAGDQDAPPYGIVGGADAALFQVSHDPIGKRFYLMFNALPNFESPADSDLDNIYEVTVNFDNVIYNYYVTVKDANDAPTGLPVISGTATEDQTLTADASGIGDEDGLGTLSYQWLRNGSAISGATSSTYTLDDSDVGAQISVQVSYTDGQGAAETVTSALTEAIAGINDAPTFVETAGVTATDLGNAGDYGQTVTVQSDGKVVLAGYSANNLAVTRYNTDGTLDTSFGGGDGIVTTDISGSIDYAYDVVVQDDGKLLVAGTSYISGNYDLLLVRYNSDGTLDNSFGGGDGIVVTDVAGVNERAYSVSLQTDGKIVVAGHEDNGSKEIVLARYNTDGTLDGSFGGGDGIVTTDIGGVASQAHDVTIQTDGKILLTGSSNNGADTDVVLVRYNTDGTLDTSFGGGDGITISDISGNDVGHGVTVQADGKILVTGYSGTSGTDFVLLRYNSDGTLDTGFGGGDGIVTTDMGGGDYGRDVVVLGDGKIVVGGYSASPSKFAVARYNSDGTLDTSFGGGDGKVITSIDPTNGSSDFGYSMTIQTDGKILVGGSSYVWTTGYDFSVARYNTDGTLDTSFGRFLTLNNQASYTEGAAAVVLDADVNVSDDDLDALNGGLGNYASASLTLVRNGGANADDLFSFNDGSGITLVGGNLIKNGQVIAAFDTTTTSGELVITFTDANGEIPTSADADNILRQITYANSSDTPPASAQIDWTFDDGNTGSQGIGGALTASGSTTVTVTATNDAPVVTAPGSALSATEQIATVIHGTGFSVTDMDEAGGGARASLSVGEGIITISTGDSGVTIDAGNGTGSVAILGSVAQINNLLTGAGTGTITYLNTSNTPSPSTIITVTVNDSGNTGADPGLTGDATSEEGTNSQTINITAVNDAPVIGGDETGTVTEDVDPDADSLLETTGALSIADPDVGESSFIAETITGTYGDLTIDAAGNWSYAADKTQAAIQNLGDGDSLIDTLTVTSVDGTPHDVTITISGVNDAPVLDTIGAVTLTDINEGDTENQGDLVSSIIASAGADPITDVDTGAVEGIAVTGVDDSNGTWEYSTDGGSNWIAFGTVSDSAAVLLTDSATDRVRFVPATNYNGTANFTYRAWDRTDGNATGTTGVDVLTTGGETAFSAATETAVITINPVQIVFYISSDADVADSGIAGVDAWTAGEVLAFGDPDFSFEPATDGTLLAHFNLDDFAADSDVDVTAFHQVSKNVTIGGTDHPAIDLQVGDLLLAVTENNEQFTGSDSVTITPGKKDVFVFRPDTAGDYSAGTFFILLNDVPSNFVTGISLVEQDTLVGDVTLQAGTFLYNAGNSADILHYSADDVGVGTTIGTDSVLIDGSDISMGSVTVNIEGLDFIESDLNVGGQTIKAGNILVTLNGDDDTVGDNGISVKASDIFLLDVTTTTMGSVSTSATATLMMEGADIKLDSPDEAISAFGFDIKFGSSNSDPIISLTGTPLDYTENDPATVIDGGASLTDVDTLNFYSGILRVDFAAGETANDQLAIRNEGTAPTQIGVSDNIVTYGGTTIGTFTGGTNGSPVVVTFNSSADVTAVQALMRNITYENASDAPSMTPRIVRFVLSDGDGGTSNVQTVNINIIAVNDAPAAVADSFTVNEGSTTNLNLATNDTDADDGLDLNSITIVSGPSNGTIDAINADGTVDYTHDGSETISDSFTYTIDDLATATSNTVTVTLTITVTAVNDAPVAVDDAITATEDTPFSSTVDLDFNDTDIDGDALSVVPGTFATAQGGSLVLAADGSYTYTPAADFTGTDSVDYTVTDGSLTDVGTLTITVTAVNDAPVAVDDAITATEDTPFSSTVDLDFNDTDIDGDALSVVPGTFATAQGGSLVLAADGSYTYTPAADFTGTDSVDYTVTDGSLTDVGTLTITVTAVNDAPVAVDDAITATEDTPFSSTVDLDFNDTDIDGDALSVVPGTFATAQGGSLVLAADGSYTYTPAADFTGTDSVDYTVTDGSLTDVGTLTITVTAVNDAPVAVDDAITATEDTPFSSTVDLDFNDTDIDGDALSVVPGTFATAQGGSLVLAADGSYTYTPAADFTGTDSVDYTVTDGSLTDVGTLTITVTAVNDAPVAVDDAITATEDTPFSSTVDLDFNDTDIDGDALSVVPGTFATAQGGSLVLAADGSYTYTPAADFTGTDSVDYTVTDGSLTDVGTLTITVTAVNDAPVAVDDAITATEDTPFSSIVPPATDADGDAVTYALETTVANGTAVVNADGSFNYTPNLNSNAPDSFTYTVSDGNGASNTYTVSINVAAVNDAPSATSSAVTAATENADYSYTITTSDVDGDVPTITATALPAWLTLVDNGDGTATLSGTPANADVGDHRVELQIFDGEFIDIQDFTVTVTGATTDDGDPDLRGSTNPDPEAFENAESDDEQDPGVEAPTHEDQPQDPVIEDEQAPPVEESLTPQAAADGDDQLVDMQDPEIEENEEIIDLTNEIDPDNLAENHGYDSSYIFFDNDLYKEIQPTDYLALDYTAFDGPIPIIEEGFSILDLDGDDANLVDLNENYDLHRQEIDESFNTEQKSQGVRANIVSITAASFAAGFVSYLLRAGSLVANLMSTLPLWRGFDPIVIFSGDKKKKKNRKDIPKTNEAKSETLFDDKVE